MHHYCQSPLDPSAPLVVDKVLSHRCAIPANCEVERDLCSAPVARLDRALDFESIRARPRTGHKAAVGLPGTRLLIFAIAVPSRVNSAQLPGKVGMCKWHCG